MQAPIAHVPLLQVADALANVHLVPQVLQLLTSVLRLTSQPLAAEPSQLPKPAVQAPNVHVLLTQLAAALANVHLVPQPPQLFTSLLELISQPSVDKPLQSLNGAVQTVVDVPQMPAVQVAVAPNGGQTLPQIPQLLISVFVFISQPLAVLPSQLAKPALHVPNAHVPLLQVADAFVNAHTVLQLLQ